MKNTPRTPRPSRTTPFALAGVALASALLAACAQDGGAAASAATAAVAAAPAAPASTPEPSPEALKLFSFFITSRGSGDGANLGGLAGADAHCQKLASAVSPVAAAKTWRAYLSTQAEGGKPAVNARDRIGKGPWHNVRGGLVARSVSHLHGDTLEEARVGNSLSWSTALTEANQPVKRVGDRPNEHDILTGSKPDGTAYTDAADHTCKNYTSNSAGSAQVGHFDRTGGNSISWNSAHASRGCSQANLVSTGGAGLFYCFAVN